MPRLGSLFLYYLVAYNTIKSSSSRIRRLKPNHNHNYNHNYQTIKTRNPFELSFGRGNMKSCAFRTSLSSDSKSRICTPPGRKRTARMRLISAMARL